MRYLSDQSIEDFFADFSQPSTPSNSFRQGMRQFTSGVTIVTSRNAEGGPVGMTATAVCSLSVSPPSLLVCAYSLGSLALAVRQSFPFCINLLAADQEEIARTCSGGAPGSQRFETSDWTIDGQGVPVLKAALVRFHCRVTELIPITTHLLIIGQVAEVELAESKAPSLVYRDGRFISVS